MSIWFPTPVFPTTRGALLSVGSDLFDHPHLARWSLFLPYVLRSTQLPTMPTLLLPALLEASSSSSSSAVPYAMDKTINPFFPPHLHGPVLSLGNL